MPLLSKATSFEYIEPEAALSPRVLRVVLLLAAALAQAQETVPSIKIDVDVVNVTCTVRDNHGAYVKDLAKNDFAITENGKPQAIRYFARETDVPMTVALMVDVSGSVSQFITKEKETAASFLEQVLRPQDKAMVVGFSASVFTWQEYTAKTDLLRAGLERMQPLGGAPAMDSLHVRPGTLLFDAIVQTATNHMKRETGRKAMIVITDGQDNGSMADRDLAERAAQATDTIVYGILYVDRHSNRRREGASVLGRLSAKTGGRMFRADGKTPLADIFAQIKEEMRSQYTVGFAPANARDGTFRRLEVKILRPGLTVQARKGYYAFRDFER